MKPGSIVELTKTLKQIDVEAIKEKIPLLSRETPYIIDSGPKMQQWKNDFGKYIVYVIILEEFPGIELNSSYFSERQAPGEISISEILSAPLSLAAAV